MEKTAKLMNINTEPIQNKQRIYIGGTNHVDEIFELIRHVLTEIDKPADFYTVGEEDSFTDAPIVFIKGGDEPENGIVPVPSGVLWYDTRREWNAFTGSRRGDHCQEQTW